MIALNNKIINNNIQNLFKKFESNVNEIKKDIENIKNFSDALEVVSINKLDKITDNDINILYYIKAYEYELLTNDYSSFKCPLCKKDNTLSFHKTYTRNIILHINGFEVIARFTMIVLECSHCKEFNKGKQHFHALIPDFVFPYHIYSSNIIIKTLIDRFIDKLKIEQILEKEKISHQLYYKWLNGFKKYLTVSSTILETELSIKQVLIEIKRRKDEFQYSFYQNYFHPYFLFRTTCVPLIIMP